MDRIKVGATNHPYTNLRVERLDEDRVFLSITLPDGDASITISSADWDRIKETV